MPEGPEVSLIAKSLDDKFSGNTIHLITIHKDSKYRSKISNNPFKEAEGSKLNQVSFKGKKIIFELRSDGVRSDGVRSDGVRSDGVRSDGVRSDGVRSDGVRSDLRYLLSSLGLEGKWLAMPSVPNAPHLSITIEFIDGQVLSFYDTRHFGTLDFCPNDKSLEKKLEPVGIPWISSKMFPETVTKDDLWGFLSSSRLKKKTIMAFLMDQKYTAGVGNYIRAEALYFSGISPHRLVNNIVRSESDDLHDSIMYVMREATRAGGHTLRSYVGTLGDPGRYVPEIYGRLSSLTNGEIIKREKDSQGRSIFWVPDVQI